MTGRTDPRQPAGRSHGQVVHDRVPDILRLFCFTRAGQGGAIPERTVPRQSAGAAAQYSCQSATRTLVAKALAARGSQPAAARCGGAAASRLGHERRGCALHSIQRRTVIIGIQQRKLCVVEAQPSIDSDMGSELPAVLSKQRCSEVSSHGYRVGLPGLPHLAAQRARLHGALLHGRARDSLPPAHLCPHRCASAMHHVACTT